MSNYDERDTIFSRIFELCPETPNYKKYYDEHPGKEECDKMLRNAPPGEFVHQEYEQNLVNGVFSLLSQLRPFSGQGEAVSDHMSPGAASNNQGPKLTASEWSSALKNTAMSYGADLCGIIPTPDEFIYSVRGRGRHYGKKSTPVLPRILIFAVEMDEQEIGKAPKTEESVEVVKGYLSAAIIGLVLRSVLIQSGYSAVVHMDGESELILPPVAAAAGLGGIGQSGLLVTREFGPRIRLGAVTTDAPLDVDVVKPFKIKAYCKTCLRCARACPAGAISGMVAEETRSKIDHERCFGQWRKYGTDCGICLEACPFSHGGRK